MVKLLPLFFLVACLPPEDRPRPWVVADNGTPTIAEFDLYCDIDAAKWELEVTATAWTGGATTVWTADEVYAETHLVSSFEAKRDGSEDVLKLSLRIVSDWREANNGGATAFRCAEDPDVIFALKGADGAIVECQTFGPNPDLWETFEDAPKCW